MKNPNLPPYPIKLTFYPDGRVTARRTSWAVYHRLNPRVTYELRDGKVVALPTNS